MARYTVFDDVLKKNVTFIYDGDDEPSDDYIDQFVLPEARQMAQPQKSGFMDKVSELLSQRGANIASAWQPKPSALRPGPETPMESFTRSGQRYLQAAGQVAGGVNDIVGQGLSAGYRSIVPQAAQDAISSGAQKVLAPVAPAIQAVQGAYGDFKGAFPEAAADVEAVANIAGVVPTGWAGKKTAGIVADAADIAKGAVTPLKTPELINRMMDTAIDKGINKGIRPSIAGKGNIVQIREYLNKAHDAVKNIVAHKDNLALSSPDGAVIKGKLPSSLMQFSEAVDQTKKSIFRQYDDMARQAGNQGAMVDLKSVADELGAVAESGVLQDLNPQVAKYAKSRMAALAKRGAYSAEEAQDAITLLNKSLESFYKNPSYENASQAGIDALIANNLRKNLDNAIENATGAGYQELKNAYGSLKTIEKDVAHRAIVDARKNIKGLVDFTDIYTSGELVAGLATMSPGMILKGATWKGVQQYIKIMNNPNRIVKSMFDDVGKLIELKNKARTP